MKRTLVGIVAAFALPSVALAWWDTQVRAQQPVPLVKEFQAAQCAGAQDVRDDVQANAGTGGKVAYVKPGSGLTFKMDLKRSVYSVWAIARADEKEFNPPAPADREQTVTLPGGDVKIPYARQPVYATLKVVQPDGATQEYMMPVTYRTEYAVGIKLYFPLHVNGPCTITVGVGPLSKIGLLVNRLEVRDTLGNCARVAAKTQRMLTTDAELAKLRADAKRPKPRKTRSTDERKAQADKMWQAAPSLNLLTADPLFAKWRTIQTGLINNAKQYEATKDPEAAWDGAIYLCALAEKYPGLDHYVSECGGYGNLANPNPLSWGSRDGKTVYSGWEGPALASYATAYDKLFDFIKDNQALADCIGTHIPWVKTPKDVIELIDTNLLQHGVDCLDRRVIRSDETAALLPLIQGVNPVSQKMLEGGLFSKVHFDMADAGGLDDQVFTAFNRGGVHYIGSMGYVGPALADIAKYLHMYCAAGGDPKFDLSDVNRYPNMPEAEKTKNGLYAGGFPIVVGDSMDLSRNREKNIPEFPPRLVEGFGETVLEEGQGQPNAMLKNAVGIYTGIGRGHAHQDTLNLEMFAHSCRLAPDLGGRQEPPNFSVPNMRTNQMHNLVEVDNKEFANLFPGSTTSGTGWTTSFSPQPGAQYMANSARATSHPNVALYERSTAMIQGYATEKDADMYLFDVFRVEGGHVHTYCFHGAYSEKVDTNATLVPAASQQALDYMARRPPETRQEAAAPDPLVVTWPLRPAMQKRYQDTYYDPQNTVAMTLTLFGHGNEKVMIGGATSKVYPVDMPYLHVQRKQDADGMVSVYPALYEAHAGAPFLTEKKLLKVTPAQTDAKAAVAVSVKVGAARHDVLFSSLKPEVACQLEDGTSVSGEFGLISEDDGGLRMMHLVGGTQLSRGGVGVRCSQPAYVAQIEKVDYPKRTMTLSAAMPAQLLDGEAALLGNERHWSAFALGTVAGKTATVQKTPEFYQSRTTYVDPQRNEVSVELEPLVYGADTLQCNGTTVTNEAQNQFWKATLQPRERWMYLGWPGTDLSYPRSVTMKDLPADKDGKHTLRLLANPGEKDKDKRDISGKVLLTMEVTRVEPEQHVFYFKMPEDPDYQQGGWEFANRIMVNADGSKKWWATYPGTSFAWSLEGAKLSDASFPDMNKDGKRKLFAYHFGPGDTFKVNTFVYVARLEKGSYQVRANTPCTVTLPGQGAVEISADGQTFRPLAAKAAGNSTEISLTVADLGAGTIVVRFGK